MHIYGGGRRNEELSWTCHFGINKATHVIELRSTWTGDVVEGEPTTTIARVDASYLRNAL